MIKKTYEGIYIISLISLEVEFIVITIVK